MALVINTNVLSLNAQRNLSTSQSSMATALQRLSSGLRINSAKDDAAGLAISDRFTTQIRGMNQAVRNANDGISLAQTAESALGELTNNLQRIRELAVQSANSTNSASDRKALNEEVVQRLAEIDRIASQTSFNGLKVLDGSFGSSQFQIGANAGETITVNLTRGVRTSQIGAIAQATGQVTANAMTGLKIKLGDGSDVAIGDSANYAGSATEQGAASAYAKAAAINGAGISGLTVSAKTEVTVGWTDQGGASNNSYALDVNGVHVIAATDTSSTKMTAQAVVNAINSHSDETGVTAVVSGTDIKLTAEDGRDITTDETKTGNGGLASEGTVQGKVTLSAAEKITLTNQTELGLNATIDLTGNMSALNVKTVDAANEAMQRVDAALTTVSSLRSTFGAIQNRFESTIANLSAVAENLSASRSRILDADFASETASLTRSQILQQAGIAILAQANAAPQSVLALLQ